MECYDVDFYHKENGDCPVDDFLESLDTKMRAKVLGVSHCWKPTDRSCGSPTPSLLGTEFLRSVLSRAAISHVFCISFTLESALF